MWFFHNYKKCSSSGQTQMTPLLRRAGDCGCLGGSLCLTGFNSSAGLNATRRHADLSTVSLRTLAFHASRCSPRVCAPRRALSAPAEKHKHGNIALNTLVPFLNSSHSTAACALLVFMLQCYILLSLPTNLSNAQTAHVGIKHDIMLYLCADDLIHSPVPSLGRKWMCLN